MKGKIAKFLRITLVVIMVLTLSLIAVSDVVSAAPATYVAPVLDEGIAANVASGYDGIAADPFVAAVAQPVLDKGTATYAPVSVGYGVVTSVTEVTAAPSLLGPATVMPAFDKGIAVTTAVEQGTKVVYSNAVVAVPANITQTEQPGIAVFWLIAFLAIVIVAATTIPALMTMRRGYSGAFPGGTTGTRFAVKTFLQRGAGRLHLVTKPFFGLRSRLHRPIPTDTPIKPPS